MFAFICRRGYSREDSEDLTQSFFESLLEGSLLARADPQHGHFRCLLLKAVKDFLGHDSERRAAKKRGGDVSFVSWHDWDDIDSSALALSLQADESASPEEVFDRGWATTLVQHAVHRLREECEAKGRLRLFEELSSYLTCERDEVSYAALADALGIVETAVKKQLHNLRRRYRWLLHDEIAQTVSDTGEVEGEIRHLCAALAAAETLVQ